MATVHRPIYDPRKASQLRARRAPAAPAIHIDKLKFSPFSPEALGFDLAGVDLLHPATPSNDQIPGSTIDGDMVKSWPKDHRDRWRTNEPSYRQWALLEESHERHRHHPVPAPLVLPTGFFLLNSVMGSGKNMIATLYGAIKYAFGWSVTSTAGTKFGKHSGPAELYHFAQVAPLGTFFIADEIHTIFHSSSSGANREMSFQDNATSMRKKEFQFLGMTASKRIAPTYRAICDWVGYVHPLYYNPRRMGNGWPETWRCVGWFGPRPWDRDDLEQELGYAESNELAHHVEHFDSNLLLEACKLFDSWADVTTMFGDGYSAAQERADREALTNPAAPMEEMFGAELALDAAGIARQLINWFVEGMFMSQEEAQEALKCGDRGQKRKTVVRVEALQGMFADAGKEVPKAAAIRKALVQRGVDVSDRGNMEIGEVIGLYHRFRRANGLEDLPEGPETLQMEFE